MLSREDLADVATIFGEAVDLDPAARRQLLDARCASRAELRAEVDSLLAAHEHVDSFMDAPVELAAQALDADRPESLVGRTAGPYKIVSQLGAGGMGDVYLAQDTRLGRNVALKFLPSYFAEDADRLRRFQQEASAASRLNHPNILTIHEVGQVDSTHYIATEHIEGLTLRAVMAQKPISLDDALDVALQVASALAAAHAAGIVHRDIKPENIMVRPDGYVKVLDFGLAKLRAPAVTGEHEPAILRTTPGLVMGTPRYMSPEQARGLDVDARSDVWSLGVVLYEMVAGRPPFDGATPTDVLAAILLAEPVPLDLHALQAPQTLGRLIARTLARHAADRFASARELHADLAALRTELNEMVTGRAPFEAPTLAAVFDSLLHHSPPPATDVNPSVPADLGRIIDTTLAKDPSARHASAAELLADRNRLRTTTSASALSIVAGRRRSILWAAGAAAVVIAAALSAWRFSGAPAPLTSPDSATRLVVLPFENLTRQSADDWLAGGFSDSLTFGLQNVGDLVLVNRERITELYRAQDVREAGPLEPQVVNRLSAMLGVRYYVHGSYQRVGETIKVVSRLVDVVSGEIKAQESVTDHFANVLQVEDELARRLAISFTAGPRPPLPVSAPRSLDAYRALTEGRSFYANNQYIQAIERLEQAVKLDSQYAEAWAVLSKALARTASQATFATVSLDATRKAAMDAAERAVALAPGFYDAHVALALASRENERLEDWRREARRAIELAPREAEAYALIADSYNVQPNWGCGRDVDAAIASDYYRKAIALDPRSAGAYNNLAVELFWRGHTDESIRVSDEGFALLPDNRLMRRRQVLELLLTNQPAAAQSAFNMLVAGRELMGSERVLLGSVLVANGRANEAVAQFDRANGDVPLSANPLWAAMMFAQHSRNDLAVKYLQEAIKMEPACAGFVARSPRFQSLQADPAGRALLGRGGR